MSFKTRTVHHEYRLRTGIRTQCCNPGAISPPHPTLCPIARSFPQTCSAPSIRSLTLTCFLPTCLFVGTLAITLANPLVSPSIAARPTFARPYFHPTWRSARLPARPVAPSARCLLCLPAHPPMRFTLRSLYHLHYGLTPRGYAPSICFLAACRLTFLLSRSIESQLATCLLAH